MKLKIVAFWFAIFALLFAWLQTEFAYHFFYIEQSQLFLFTQEYLNNKLTIPGGFSFWVASFLVQFYSYPYVGPLITAGLLTIIGFLTARVVKRIIPKSNGFVLYLLPMIFLLFMHFDFNYRVQGSVSFLLMLLSFYGYQQIRKDSYRLITGLCWTPCLFGLAGPVALLWAVVVCLYEWLQQTRRAYLSCVGLVEVGLLGVIAIYCSWLGEYRWAFTPDLYYHTALQPKAVIYYAWLAFPLVLLVAFYLRSRTHSVEKPLLKKTSALLQVLSLVALLAWGIPKFGDQKALFLKKLDYFTRTEQWDKTIEACQGKLTNYLYLCHLNMALAQKGQLADRMFHFDQRGLMGLFVQWNKSENISCLLSDIYFTMGAVSSSQEMAFEGYVSAMEEGNPRMLKRLVQTNLIYGAYPVAEKYISLLEKTYVYKDWATAQRVFLYRDDLIEKDPVLGLRRQLLPEKNTLASINGLPADLERFIQQGPANSAALHYLGAIYLLSKDLQGFKKMIDLYYGTSVLPTLPIHFQEAILLIAEKEPDYWKRFHLSDSLVTRFADFKKQVLSSQNKAAVSNLLNRSFGDTYWFYLMFK